MDDGELPPNNSIVSVRSYGFDTYLAACEDRASIKLEKVDDPNNLPPNCLWTLQKKSYISAPYTLRFIGCYGRYLATKASSPIRRTICQDYPISSVTRYLFAGWAYTRLSHPVPGCKDYGCLTGSAIMRAEADGSVSLKITNLGALRSAPQPEFYWIIEAVGSTATNTITTSSLYPSYPTRLNPPINNNIININRPVAINSGGNHNFGYGTQHSGGVQIGNDSIGFSLMKDVLNAVSSKEE